LAPRFGRKAPDLTDMGVSRRADPGASPWLPVRDIGGDTSRSLMFIEADRPPNGEPGGAGSGRARALIARGLVGDPATLMTKGRILSGPRADWLAS